MARREAVAGCIILYLYQSLFSCVMGSPLYFLYVIPVKGFMVYPSVDALGTDFVIYLADI